MPRRIQRFEVGLKAFVVRGEELLVVREADTGYWELPGGRIDVGEELLPPATILRREILEELGAGFRVDLGPVVVSWVRRRGDDDYVFLVGRLCEYRSGDPELSAEHSARAWVTRHTWRDLGWAPGYPEALDEFWQGRV